MFNIWVCPSLSWRVAEVTQVCPFDSCHQSCLFEFKLEVMASGVYCLKICNSFQTYGSKDFLLHIPTAVVPCEVARLFVEALWSPAWKGLTSWLSFVMCICDVVTFPLVSWVRCGA